MALMSAALHEAMAKLKAQERATAARAQASERLSEDIIASLTAGLLVVGRDGGVRILNPAGRKMLGLADTAPPADIGRALSELGLSAVIQECFGSGNAVLRRTLSLAKPHHGISHFGVGVSPLFDDDNQIDGAICLFTDLTAVKELQKQLRVGERLATAGRLTGGTGPEDPHGPPT